LEIPRLVQKLEDAVCTEAMTWRCFKNWQIIHLIAGLFTQKVKEKVKKLVKC
jgi:hypothetical protein